MTNYLKAKSKTSRGKWEPKIAAYLKSHEKKFQPTTLITHGSKLRVLARHDFDPTQFYDSMVDERRSRYTIQVYMFVGQSFEKWLKKDLGFETFLEENGYCFKNAYKTKVRDLSHQEVLEILEEAKSLSPHFWDLCWLMAFGGLRISEALNAHPRNLKDHSLSIVGKGLKQRNITVDPRQLQHWIGTHKPISAFLNLAQIRRWVKAMKVSFTPHDLRAYYIVTRLRNREEYSYKDVQRLVGHSSVSITEKYDRYNEESVAQKEIRYLNKVFQKTITKREETNDSQRLHDTDRSDDREMEGR